MRGWFRTDRPDTWVNALKRGSVLENGQMGSRKRLPEAPGVSTIFETNLVFRYTHQLRGSWMSYKSLEGGVPEKGFPKKESRKRVPTKGSEGFPQKGSKNAKNNIGNHSEAVVSHF